MAIAFRAATSGGAALSASPQTITLPATTLLNDCIVVVVGNTNSSTPIGTMSGAGATWVGYSILIASSRNLSVFIGYGCSAGSTTITLTGNPTTTGNLVVGMFSGVLSTSNPVRNEVQVAAYSANGVAAVTPSLTFVGGDLLIGGSDTFQWALTPGKGSWSSGATDSLADITSPSLTHDVALDYSVTTTGTTTTFTSPLPLSTQGAISIAVALKPTAGFTVTFDNNGGTGTMSAETESTATALSLFSTGTMAYAGYTFDHWNTAADNSGTSYADGASYPFTASVTLYAIWAAIPSGFFAFFMT